MSSALMGPLSLSSIYSGNLYKYMED